MPPHIPSSINNIVAQRHSFDVVQVHQLHFDERIEPTDQLNRVLLETADNNDGDNSSDHNNNKVIFAKSLFEVFIKTPRANNPFRLPNAVHELYSVQHSRA